MENAQRDKHRIFAGRKDTKIPLHCFYIHMALEYQHNVIPSIYLKNQNNRQFLKFGFNHNF